MCDLYLYISSVLLIWLPFHLEMSKQTIRNVIENCRDELVKEKDIRKTKISLNPFEKDS